MTGPGHVPPQAKQLRIGLWGPPGSGKTTFLAALKIATTRRPEGEDNWIMHGADEPATEFLQITTEALTMTKRFPPATLQPENMVFRFTGEQRFETRNWRGKRGVETRTAAFDLEVLDVPGRAYRNPDTHRLTDSDEADEGFSTGNEGFSTGVDSQAGYSEAASSHDPDAMEEGLLDHLQYCDGIIYLFDPERDASEGDAFRYFHPVLEKLTRRVMEAGQAGSRLRHHVAVCVTKFDKPDIYKKARLRGFTVHDEQPPYLPRVDDQRAGEFFQLLCQDPQSNTDMVERGLRQYFANLNYFVTSSVGFYVAGGRFRPFDCMNVERVGPAHTDYKIKGRVYPINVLEPLLWLYTSLAQQGVRR